MLFLEGLPEGICNPGKNVEAEDAKDSARGTEETGNREPGRTAEDFIKGLQGCQVLSLEGLVPYLRGLRLPEAVFAPENPYLRAMHYQGEAEFYYFVNEDEKRYEGTVCVPGSGPSMDMTHGKIRFSV